MNLKIARLCVPLVACFVLTAAVFAAVQGSTATTTNQGQTSSFPLAGGTFKGKVTKETLRSWRLEGEKLGAGKGGKDIKCSLKIKKDDPTVDRAEADDLDDSLANGTEVLVTPEPILDRNGVPTGQFQLVIVPAT